jgi:exopolyphosphatase/guanosine-5'-triphosphate,3'-diphosphate pyrophosphatase
MMRVGAIDCGTNSIRLLIADLTEDGALMDIVRDMEIVRLGQGIDRTGRIDPAAMTRTLRATQTYAALCRRHDVQKVRFVATSASRDAENAADFVAGVEEAFGDLAVTPEVISGATEASLSFSGATGDLLAAGQPGPYLVVDIGGGSTELVRGTRSVEQAISVDIGCVRITERDIPGDPPTQAEIEAALGDVNRALDQAQEAVDLAGISTVVGLAGSVTTVTAYALGLRSYDPSAIHLADLSVAEHQRAAALLLGMARGDRASLGFMHPGRVDVIGAGALIWSEVLARVQASSPNVRVVTSEHDILDGIALSLRD